MGNAGPFGKSNKDKKYLYVSGPGKIHAYRATVPSDIQCQALEPLTRALPVTMYSGLPIKGGGKRPVLPASVHCSTNLYLSVRVLHIYNREVSYPTAD